MKRLKKEVSVVAKTCLKYSFKGIARQQRPLLQLPYLVPFFPITPYWIFYETRIVFPTEVNRTLSKNTAEQATLPEEEVSGENKENIRHPKYKYNLVKVKGKDVCGQKTVTEYRKDIGTSDTALEEMVS